MNKDKKEADSQIRRTNYWLPWGEGTGKGQDGVGKFFSLIMGLYEVMLEIAKYYRI